MPAGVYSYFNITNNTFTSPDISPKNAESYQNVVYAFGTNWVIDYFLTNNVYRDFANGRNSDSNIVQNYVIGIAWSVISNNKFINITCE